MFFQKNIKLNSSLRRDEIFLTERTNLIEKLTTVCNTVHWHETLLNKINSYTKLVSILKLLHISKLNKRRLNSKLKKGVTNAN